MPSMETGNSTARAEELKLQANEAFKGVYFRLPQCYFVSFNYPGARVPLGCQVMSRSLCILRVFFLQFRSIGQKVTLSDVCIFSIIIQHINLPKQLIYILKQLTWMERMLYTTQIVHLHIQNWRNMEVPYKMPQRLLKLTRNIPRCHTIYLNLSVKQPCLMVMSSHWFLWFLGLLQARSSLSWNG